MIPRNRAIASKFAGYPLVAVEEDFASISLTSRYG